MGKLTYIICGKLYDGIDRELKEFSDMLRTLEEKKVEDKKEQPE